MELGIGKDGEGRRRFKKLKMVQELWFQSQSAMQVSDHHEGFREAGQQHMTVFASSQAKNCQYWSHLPDPREDHSPGELGLAWHLGSVIASGFKSRFASWTTTHLYLLWALN